MNQPHTNTDEILNAGELAGHCNEMTAWRILMDVSQALESGGTAPVVPALIAIQEDGSFSLAKPSESFQMGGFAAPEISEGPVTEASCVWSLAASVFFVVMGRQVMNDKGGAAQRESSKLPFMRSTWPLLSETVQRCLSFHPEQRPSLEEIHAMASQRYNLCMETIKKGPKFQEKKSGTDQNESQSMRNLTFWPETMKKALLVMILFCSTTFGLRAQQAIDKETQHLIDVVSAIRKADPQQREQAWNSASQALSTDKSWTIMDEIRPHSSECRLTDRSVQWFAINRILSNKMGYEANQVRGDFNNGENPDFNYSLIERSIKAGQTANYDLKSREGEQAFVLVPFDTQANLEAEVTRGGTTLAKGTRKADGNIYLIIGKDQNVKASDVLNLVVTNKSDKSCAYVLINHNVRQ